MFVYEPRILGFGDRRGMTAALKEGSLGRDFGLGLSGSFSFPEYLPTYCSFGVSVVERSISTCRYDDFTLNHLPAFVTEKAG